jgi:hypothetical protein
LSPHGIRSLSKRHAAHPFVLELDGQRFVLDYEPGESTTPLFGGNSNWRGPVGFPINFLLIEALQKHHYFLGDDFKVECPTGSGRELTLWEVTTDLTRRLIGIFLQDETAAGPSTAAARCSTPIRTGAISSRSTNISTATPAPGSARAIRRAGPDSSRS